MWAAMPVFTVSSLAISPRRALGVVLVFLVLLVVLEQAVVVMRVLVVQVRVLVQLVLAVEEVDFLVWLAY